MLLKLDTGLFNSNAFKETLIQHFRGKWYNVFVSLYQDVSRSSNFLALQRVLRVSVVLRAVWMWLVSLSLCYAQLVWQQVISAPGRICSYRLIHPSHGTTPITLNQCTHAHRENISFFAQPCLRKTLKMLVHHQKGKTRVFVPLARLGSKNRGQNSGYIWKE